MARLAFNLDRMAFDLAFGGFTAGPIAALISASRSLT
jgi:hypothetical protein